MKLMTKELERKLSKYPLRSQEDKVIEEREIIVKYFNPIGAETWLITEGEKQENGEWLLYGYCHISEWEWSYVSLDELENVKLPFGKTIERDLYTNNKYIKDYIDKYLDEEVSI